MDSISNSGISVILNPVIINDINDNQHDLSTCEEEFENQEEIEQMLVNAFDSQSLSNTDNDEHAFDDVDDNHQHLPIRNESLQKFEYLQQENETLHRHIVEDTFWKNELKYEHQINELNEKHEQNLLSFRLEYETKIEQLTNKINEQEIEILTLKHMYEMVFDEKCRANEQINDIQLNKQNLQEKLNKLQIDYDQLLKSPFMINVHVQTEFNNEIEQNMELLEKQNIKLIDELTQKSNQLNELQTQFYSSEYFEQIFQRPTMTSIKIQTDFLDDDRKIKQLETELHDYKLKINSKQMEINSLKFDYDNLKQEINDNLSTEQLNKIIFERNYYLNEFNKLKMEISEQKQQIIDNFQKKIILFKEQIKRSLVNKENDYKKKIEQIENEYICQYEQMLEKNKQIIHSLIASKQEEFDKEKSRIISEYEDKLKILQIQKLSNDERHMFERKIEELIRVNDKCSQYIAKREKEYRQRENISLNFQQFIETKRKYNDEIHRLYDQITKQNQQQLTLIDEHQKQIEQLKTSYEQRYRMLLDEWKIYNNDLHDNNANLKAKLKEYEKTIVQLRYHIINLQIEFFQNNSHEIK